MATLSSDAAAREHVGNDSFEFSAGALMRMLGSLKLTVALFAVSLVIVLVGTLAQDEMNMLEVKQRYFLSWVAMLHFDDFFPQAFYRHESPIPGVIPFPGGALIGTLLMINLVAAKATRFKIHADGSKLAAGLGFLVLGVVVAGLIIMAGHSNEGLQGRPPISYDQLWGFVVAALGVVTASLGIAAARAENRFLKITYVVPAVVIGLFVLFALVSGFRVDDPGLRIVWQLTKGLGAGLILLVGCLIMFGKQGGNVLLHMGVGLLMVGQFVFGDRQLEQRLSLVEGQSTNTLVNLDEVELTFIRHADGEKHVVAIPASRLERAARTGEVIRDEQLPVNVRVVALYENSTLTEVSGENPATAGVGLELMAKEQEKSGGADTEMNLASAYVELIDKQTGEPLGTHLVSQLLSDREMLMPTGRTPDTFDEVTVGETAYDVGLRFHREVKPYWVQLEDVRRTTYSGTETPRDFSSFIRIVDNETGEDRKERVWMNNPLRYRGETFYQSSYSSLPGGKEMTGIQVVRNSGWLIPYVACSITALGMFVHFSGTLGRFLRRRKRETDREFEEVAAFSQSRPSRWPVYASVAGLGLLALVMLVPWTAVHNALRPSARDQAFDLYTAGKIPVQFGGRVMPLDAYARQTLKAISNKESLPLDAAPGEIKDRASGSKLSAMQWLLEVAVDAPSLRYLPMFRIDADEVRSEFGLPRRESKLYSLEEISGEYDRVAKLVEAARAKDPLEQSFKEKKLIELDQRTRRYTLTAAAFRLPVPPEIPASLFPEGTSEQTRQLFALRQLERQMESLEQMPAPAVVPPSEETARTAIDQPDWSPFAVAFFDMAKRRAEEGEAAATGIDTFGELVKHYGNEDTLAFNDAVDQHLAAVGTYRIAGYDRAMVALERWMESNWPTGVAMILYLITMILGLIYFAVDLPRLREIVWGTLLIAFAIHTVTILCRILITGRAPVINLYSSAVFIGWAAVLFGLIIERLFRYGTGNMLSSAAGVFTLLVAYGLNTGDTMPVLQAVLDTQFWLSTHVISVSLGYVATLVAGLLGIGYLAAGWIGKGGKTLRDLYRMCYGAACFGILFSFVGTVLGGLWADDSWGRFWGWDPKENGALLIVIWNALMLHARWDGLVGGRGFSILAIGGNIVTAWSWFGTNELGIGLHSYGFTEGALMWLSLFMASQAALIVAGLTLWNPRSEPSSD